MLEIFFILSSDIHVQSYMGHLRIAIDNVLFYFKNYFYHQKYMYDYISELP